MYKILAEFRAGALLTRGHGSSMAKSSASQYSEFNHVVDKNRCHQLAKRDGGMASTLLILMAMFVYVCYLTDFLLFSFLYSAIYCLLMEWNFLFTKLFSPSRVHHSINYRTLIIFKTSTVTLCSFINILKPVFPQE